MGQAPEHDEVELSGFPRPDDPQGLRAREKLEVLMAQFADEVRLGLYPTTADYARKYPDLAESIEELFPLISSLECWKSDQELICLRRNLPRNLPFQKLGNYEIVGELGRGGMGVVLEAVQINTRQRVAIKLLPWRYAADLTQRQARFRHEAETIASLRQRNIVRVYSFGQAQGYCYYVMEMVQGLRLDHPSYDWRKNWKKVAEAGVQVARALAYAHDRGVLHNDIKPGNLLLEDGGRVVVTDFGLHCPDDSVPVDQREIGVGTVRYMAPERFEGGADPRSDLYALGATLYELVTGEPPYCQTDRQKLLQEILQRPIRSPRQLVPDVPVALERILLQALARRPADRYPNAAALAADLLRFANGQPVEARPLSLSRRLGDWTTNLHQLIRAKISQFGC